MIINCNIHSITISVHVIIIKDISFNIVLYIQCQMLIQLILVYLCLIIKCSHIVQI